MFKKFEPFDKSKLEFVFNSGSTGRIPFAAAYDRGNALNIDPYDNDNEVRFGLAPDNIMKKSRIYRTNTELSAAATFGQLNNYAFDYEGEKLRNIVGQPDHYTRFFTAFNQNEKTQVPIVIINPHTESRLYSLPTSSFTVEMKFYPEKAAGPYDDVINKTISGSVALQPRADKMFGDSNLISFMSVSQDNNVLHNVYSNDHMKEATASFQFKLAGSVRRLKEPSALNALTSKITLSDRNKRFYYDPGPIIEAYGLSGSDDSGFFDKYPASFSMGDPGEGWKRSGITSASSDSGTGFAGGYYTRNSKWHYTYVSWNTGSFERYTSSLKFDKYGEKNKFIGGVINYMKDSDGLENFATWSVANPGQNHHEKASSTHGKSLWSNITQSQNFRKLGKNVGSIQLGGLFTPYRMDYLTGAKPKLIEGPQDNWRKNAVDYWTDGISGSNAFYGGIKELRIWNESLDHNTLATWSTQEINNNHPYLDNLVGYWKFDLSDGAPNIVAVGRGATDPVSVSGLGTLHLPTSSFVAKVPDLTYQNDAFFIFNPHSGSGFLPNNDNSVHTSMRKQSEYPPLNVDELNVISSTNRVTKTNLTKDGSTISTTFNNPDYYTVKSNPYKVISGTYQKVGDGFVAGSFKINFDLLRVIGAPLISSSAYPSIPSKWSDLDSSSYYVATNRSELFRKNNPDYYTNAMSGSDRVSKNRTIRPSQYMLPRLSGTYVTNSYKVALKGNGSGSIYPMLSYNQLQRCGIIGLPDGIGFFRDKTYDGLSNLYVYSASALDYTSADSYAGSLDIPGSSVTTRAEYASTASGFFDATYEYSSSLKTVQYQFNCKAGFNEFNASANSTYAEAFGNVTPSSNQSGSVTYINSVGLYDDTGNLLMVASLAKPIRKEPGQAITTKVRFDN